MVSTEQNNQKYVVEKLSASDFSDHAIVRASTKNFSVCVRADQQNSRQGTVGHKGRSDVSYSNKKPWKQKGTGRARAGSARSPVWRGGGVAFGPEKRTRELFIMKKVKKAVMATLFLDLLNNKRVICADWFLTTDSPKTAAAYNFLKSSHLIDRKVAVFVTPDDVVTYMSFVNIENVELFFFDQPNIYDLARNYYWLVLKKDINYFKDMVSQWI